MAKAKGKKTIIYKGSVRKAAETFSISDKDIEAFKSMGFEVQEEIDETLPLGDTKKDDLPPNDDNLLDGEQKDDKTPENDEQNNAELPPNVNSAENTNVNSAENTNVNAEEKTEFVCPVCNKVCANQSGLTKHIKTHQEA